MEHCSNPAVAGTEAGACAARQSAYGLIAKLTGEMAKLVHVCVPSVPIVTVPIEVDVPVHPALVPVM